MPLAPGTRLGPYEVIVAIGAGGMGEVYRARDTKLQRDVAIKILPELFAADPDHLTRFSREAQTLASLNHQNIAHVYGVVEVPPEAGNHRVGIVMELVEGQDLAQRLARGALPVDDAIELALQIACGLEAAHERGIVHRDLKPANVRVTPDGTAKILDFGLAKAVDDAGSRDAAHAMNSPTFTSPATQLGVILGTAAYMAPEQARGKAVDRRADIWAFGCVVYEMLTAKRPFGGETVTDALAAIVKEDPDWSALPRDTPASVRELLRQCLVKDPKQRLRDIGDARIALERIGAGTAEEPVAAAAVLPARASRTRVGAMILGAVAVATLAALVTWLAIRPAASVPPPLARFATALPLEALPLRTGGTGVAFAPDGTSVVYAAQPVLANAPGLFRRRLNALEVEKIPNTEGALAPFFSPDSRWIGFFTDRGLMKISVDGQGLMKICDRTRFSRGSWAPDGTIILGTSQAYANGPLAKVSAAGGTPVDLTSLAERETAHQLPHVLPGGRHVLFSAIRPDRSDVAIVSIEGGTHQPLGLEGSGAMFVPPDRMLFAKGRAIFVVEFDPRTNRASGTPMQVLDEAAVGSFAANVWVPAVGVDAAGSAAFLNKGGTSTPRWIAPASSPISVPAADYRQPILSPDGRRFVVSAGAAPAEIWVIDLDRGTRLMLTTAGDNIWPIWSHDGQRVIYTGATGDLMSVPADGSGKPEVLLGRHGSVSVMPTSVARDGSFVVVNAEDRSAARGGRNRDIWIVRQGQKPEPVVATDGDDRTGVVSPDGRWLAYSSSTSGRYEIYIKDLTSGRTIPVSSQSGTTPRWPRMDTLYFLGVRELMRVPIQLDPFKPGAPVLAVAMPPNNGYDVTADGRVLIIEPKSSPTGTRDMLHVLLNWGSSLK